MLRLGGTAIALVAGVKNTTAVKRNEQRKHVTRLDIQWSKESRWEVSPTIAARKANVAVKETKRLVLVLSLLCTLLMQLPIFAAQDAMLTWNPSTDSRVTGYNVYYGSTSGVYTNIISVGSVTNVAVAGLAAGNTYYFAVTGRDAAGTESSFSSEVSYSVPSPAVLSMNTVKSQGNLTSVSITATGTVPDHWAVESSSDLKTWTVIVRGTNSPVNVSIPVDGIPQQFFRLKSE